jgi:hypothetical protein
MPSGCEPAVTEVATVLDDAFQQPARASFFVIKPSTPAIWCCSETAVRESAQCCPRCCPDPMFVIRGLDFSGLTP